MWVWVKIKPPGDRTFQSMLPFTRVPFWVLYLFLTHSHVDLESLEWSMSSPPAQGIGTREPRTAPRTRVGELLGKFLICFSFHRDAIHDRLSFKTTAVIEYGIAT